jgi:hypothetical protein
VQISDRRREAYLLRDEPHAKRFVGPRPASLHSAALISALQGLPA